jgi:hypothetical protein
MSLPEEVLSCYLHTVLFQSFDYQAKRNVKRSGKPGFLNVAFENYPSTQAHGETDVLCMEVNIL